jgi:outer membrane protein assembly factor BamB
MGLAGVACALAVGGGWELSRAGAGHTPTLLRGRTPSTQPRAARQTRQIQPRPAELIWRFHHASGGIGTPVVSHGVLYVTGWDGYLYALRASDGTRKWTASITSVKLESDPALVGDLLCVAGSDGKIHALRASDALPVWRYATGDSFASAPVVAADVVYFGGYKGLYALRA